MNSSTQTTGVRHMVNAFLNEGEVVVAIEHLHDDSNGAFSLATVWDGSSLREISYANAYNRGSFDDAEVNANTEQKRAASVWYVENKEDIKMIGNHASYIGCKVVLSRSRKAPNGTPLLVVNFSAGGYNEQFRCHEPSKIAVETEDSIVWVSASTIKSVVEYAAPWWA